MSMSINMLRQFRPLAWALWIALGVSAQSQAATTDLASSPISTTSGTAVLPNILFTLDDSGSMAWSYLPDYAGGTTYSGGTARHCKVSNNCGKGETPYQANEYNGIAYNPRLTYQLPVNADGSLKPSFGSPWTTVPVDGYGIQSAGTINLTNGYPEAVYCESTLTTCKKDGVDTFNPFQLRPSLSTDNPPAYAFPGSLTTGTTVGSTPQDGLMNQSSPAALAISTIVASTPASVALPGPSVSHAGSTVTVSLASAPANPLATGDNVVVTNGASCSSGYRSGGNLRPITVIDATHFTYDSNSGTGWGNTACTVTVTYTKRVTVNLTGIPTPALASGNLVTVVNSTGTCDVGYKVTSVPMTRINSTSFMYLNATTAVNAANKNCAITQFAIPPSPGINLSGSTVTVYKTAHGLTTGDLIQVSNGTSGTCSSGYSTNGTVAITVVDANTFTYSPPAGVVKTDSDCKIERIIPGGTVAYDNQRTEYANPYYFTILPVEFCDSMYLTNCVAATAPTTVSGVNYSFPAPVRFCKDTATAALPPGDSGAQLSFLGAINCQAKYSVGTGINYQSVRYGLFWRGDIVPARTSYGTETYTGTVDVGGVNMVFSGALAVDRSKRSDCASVPNCTYDEEMTNFANWYAYYGTRMQMMKSSAGRSFNTLNNRYRVGFATINESASKYLAMGQFTSGQKTNWYAKLYAINPGSSTPLREALAHAGRYFAGKKPGIFTDDPMQYACQQNYELITTDGYWNGTDTDVFELDGTTVMQNYDNVDSGMSKRSDGAYDGAVSGAENTLADVAMYYYMTDLRNPSITPSNCTGSMGVDVCADEVPMTAKDTLAGLNGQQHMTTFSLGLADGLMSYQSDYESSTTGDFASIKSPSASNCSFSGSGNKCNWPLPVHDSQAALDDLWHAAVNGRGKYYNARDPDSLSRGLSDALEGINVHNGAAAASATSSPIITQTDRTIFSSTYRTAKWDGEVVARLIDPVTGNVQPAIQWAAQAQLDSLVATDLTASIASRHIYTFDDSNGSGNHLKNFFYGSLTAAEKSYFDSKCSFLLLTQCSVSQLSASDIAAGNVGLNLVHWLRGNRSMEAINSPSTQPTYRAREHLLGDTVNARPTYVKAPQYSFTDAVTPSYSTFKSMQTTRQGVLYMGSNDGMLHAFNTDTGVEMWAYVPKIVMPNLYKLTEMSYATLHQYYVDGSPETMDIYINSSDYPTSGLATGWHTILVGALGLGGRGFYALDVTDPANPVALWEFCSDSTLCALSDIDMGYSYGNPVITKRSTDGKWVVILSSGYNNVSPGSGKGTMFVLDPVTGLDAITGTATYTKTYTGAATNPPSGLAKLSPWVDNLSANHTTRYVYGGDLNGDVWRFDLGPSGSTAAPTATRIASVKDASGVAQSVTTRVELGDPMNNVSNSLYGTGNPVVFVVTGRYLGISDPTTVQIQSVYALKDTLTKTGTAADIGNPRSPNLGFAPFVRQYIYSPTTNTRTTSLYSVFWSSNSGWYADLQVMNELTNLPVSPSPSPGERVRLDPHLVSGTLSVISSVPGGSTCAIGGTSWKYSFDFMNGQSIPSHTVGVLINEGAEGSVVVDVAGRTKELITLTGGDTVTYETPTKGKASTRQSSWRELLQ